MARALTYFASLLLMLPLTASIEPILTNKPIHEALVPKAGPLLPQPVSALQPPMALSEHTPPKPDEDLIWIPGYWVWQEESSSYAWVCGVWRRPPPNMHWISGEWVNQEGGWTRLLGFWSPADSLAIIAEIPPELPQESPPPAPGDDYFYFKGYWEYTGGSYQYQPGSWQPFDPNWILAQPAYYWRPDGYRFTPAYWDYSLDDRGYAYDCEAGNGLKLQVIEPQTIIQQLYVYYPDYIPIYWHWWHYHPGFWDGCWCMPPWWGWNGWWGLGWHEQWGLWWWWAHPGFPAPMWMSAEFAQKIAPPHEKVIDLFKKTTPPIFVTPKGLLKPKDFDHLDKPLLPKNPKEWEAIKDNLGNKLPNHPHYKPDGKPGIKDVPTPKIPGERPDQMTPPKKPIPIPPKPATPPGKTKLPQKPKDITPDLPKVPPKDVLPPKPQIPDRPQVTPPHPKRPDLPELPDADLTPPKPQMPDRPQYVPPQSKRPDMPQMPPQDMTPPRPQMPDRPQFVPPQSKRPDMPKMPPQDMTPPRPQYNPPAPQPNLPPQTDNRPVIKTFPTPENRPQMTAPQMPSRQDIKDRKEFQKLERNPKDDN